MLEYAWVALLRGRVRAGFWAVVLETHLDGEDVAAAIRVATAQDEPYLFEYMLHFFNCTCVVVQAD